MSAQPIITAFKVCKDFGSEGMGAASSLLRFNISSRLFISIPPVGVKDVERLLMKVTRFQDRTHKPALSHADILGPALLLGPTLAESAPEAIMRRLQPVTPA